MARAFGRYPHLTGFCNLPGRSLTPLFKTALYLGAVLLLGAVVFRRYIGPELAPTMTRTLRLGALLGALLFVTVSVADVTWTVTQLLGRFDGAFILEYLWSTNHGRATLVRVVLATIFVVIFMVVQPNPKPHNPVVWLSVPVSLGLLATFSFLSHAAAMHGPPALLADLAHLTAATLWGGAVFYTALSPLWRREPAALTGTMGRLSSLGLGCVLLLSATGVYASVLHLARPAELTTTPYGLALVLKLVLVGIVLGIAALNRWWLLPALKQGKTRRLGQMLRLEAALLIAVFAATGILTTRPLPH